jgi:hypothetical protein
MLPHLSPSFFFLAHLRRRTNDTRGERQQHYKPPLGVEMTGYHLFNIAAILAFGIPKAVSSYRGQSVIPKTLDWVEGTLVAVMYLRF